MILKQQPVRMGVRVGFVEAGNDWAGACRLMRCGLRTLTPSDFRLQSRNQTNQTALTTDCTDRTGTDQSNSGELVFIRVIRVIRGQTSEVPVRMGSG